MAKKTKEPKKLKVYTPNRYYTGIRRGVQIEEGTGLATKEQAQQLQQLRYYVPELDEKVNKPEWFETKYATDDTDSEDKDSGEDSAKGSEKSQGSQSEDDEESEDDVPGPGELPRPSKNATNDELTAFMKKHGIEFETDDNKPDLLRKIDAWYESQKEAGSSK